MSYKNYDPFFDDDQPENRNTSSNSTEQNQQPTNFKSNFFENNDNDKDSSSSFFTNLNNDDESFNRPIDITPTNPAQHFENNGSSEPTQSGDNGGFFNNNGNNNNGGYNNGNGGYNGDNGGYNNRGRRKKEKRQIGIGLMLVIMIPVLIITNIVTSLFVFNNVWYDAKREFEAEINNIVAKENNLNGDTSLLSYNIAKQEMPSVVEIYTSYASGSAAATGFVITDSGYILTNAHAVTYISKSFQGIGPGGGVTSTTKICEKVVVQFEGNETQYKVEVISYDTTLDLAVLKMLAPPSNLRAAKFGDSTLLSFGEPCVAIGNAKGYGLAVTEGVISAPIQYYNLSSRDNALTAAVQHSAAINQGNSGGPLFNMYGLVVGINSFKLTSATSEVAIDGMGFAIPSAVAKDYVNGLNISGLKISYTPNPVPTQNN
ncbi:MAG: trypsin-like peptidase domain-containing protein [Clostridia bacterium]